MKILVMSLHRIGDIVMTTPILSGLKRKHPQAQIHLLIHSQFKGVVPLLKDVDKVFYFDHTSIQSGLGEAQRGIFESYDRVEGLIADLTQQKYDVTINLTHTKLSGWLSGLIPAREKRGLVLDPTGTPKFGSRWFEYLNQTGTRQREDTFHFVDIFYYGSGLSQSDRKINLQETEAGQIEAHNLTANLNKYVCLQPLSSDLKKNWGIEKWTQALIELGQICSQYTFLLLGAPNEEAELKKLSDALSKEKIRHRLAICTLEGVYSVLKSAELLITSDTSIKHIAAATSVPILELSMGSSSFQRTGVYSRKGVILQSIESCAPCVHSDSCPYETHKCGDRVSPEGVALVSHAMLTKNLIELETLAREFSDEFDLYRIEFSSLGDWNAFKVSESFSKKTIINWIDRSSHRLYFNESPSEELMAYGSEGVQLKHLFNSLFPDRDKYTWIEMYKEIETDCQRFLNELEVLMTELRLLISDFDSELKFEVFKKRIDSLCSDQKHSELFKSYVNTLKLALGDGLASGSRFYMVKKMREILTTAIHRSQIEFKIVRSLKNQMLEDL